MDSIQLEDENKGLRADIGSLIRFGSDRHLPIKSFPHFIALFKSLEICHIPALFLPSECETGDSGLEFDNTYTTSEMQNKKLDHEGHIFKF